MLNTYPLAKDLQVLVEIVHSGSFSAAAAALGQTPAFVTKRIQILESTLGTTLLSRSARGVILTESGQRCYEHAQAILAGYQHLVDDVTQLKTRPAGMIRIGCSFGFGRSYIAPAITELMHSYPELQVHFELYDRQIDLAQDNIDLDIRINDEIPDYYIAHLLTKNRRILCAAPTYLQKYGEPTTLQELSRHDCLVTKERDMTHGVWELDNGQRKSRSRWRDIFPLTAARLCCSGRYREKGLCCVPNGTCSRFWQAVNWCACCRTMRKAPISGRFIRSRCIAA